MTWEEYKSNLSPEERLSIFTVKSRASTGYMRHYMAWRKKNVPGFLESCKKHWKNRKPYKREPGKSAHYVRAWRAKNPERNRELARRHRNTPIGKLYRSVRSRLRDYLARGVGSHKTREVIGIDHAGLIAWIEAQFTEGMTWDNYGFGDGKWGIDHIIPLSSSKGDEVEVLKLSHYTNLQPMWHKDNVAKSDKIA